MKVVVASHNPVKRRAVEEAFQQTFACERPKIACASVSSGVSDQPMSDGETRRGARNRAQNARETEPSAEFWVGLEGGIELIGNQLMAFAWIAVLGRSGAFGEARTVTLPLPPAIKTLVDSGVELGDANDQVFLTVNSKQKGGAFGLLTDGKYTRESVYTQAVIIALVPFVNDLFSSAAGGGNGES